MANWPTCRSIRPSVQGLIGRGELVEPKPERLLARIEAPVELGFGSDVNGRLRLGVGIEAEPRIEKIVAVRKIRPGAGLAKL